jgi:D-serine deaminase-like pyridoxal phosphate-dependent protein
MALSLARARAPRRSLASALRQLPFHAAEGARAPQTPLVVVDGATLVTNLSLMQERANLLGVRLRPHVKTHKSLAVAHMQLGLGADGVTASKVSEAIVFIEGWPRPPARPLIAHTHTLTHARARAPGAGGVPSVSVAYPVVDVAKARELMRAARLAGAEVRLAVDSVEGVQSAVAAAEAEDVRGVRLLLEIDVGLHRCGVDARRRGAVEQFVEAALPALGNRVALTGVMSHAGHAYAAPDAATLTRIQEEETTLMTEARARLAAALRVGEEAVECSVGSTPTELLPRAGGARGITHLQPGNYVYLDLTTVGKGEGARARARSLAARLADAAAAQALCVRRAWR